MSNNSHFLAVNSELLRRSFDVDDFLSSDGLEWCGDTFETGYVFREQIDTVISPLLSPKLRAVLDGEAQTVADPSIDLLRQNEDGAEIIAFSPTEFAELRSAVKVALASSNWGTYDAYEWHAFAENETAADLYVLVEFV